MNIITIAGRIGRERREIPGTDGYYSTDRLGNIYSESRMVTGSDGIPRRIRFRRLKPKLSRTGYWVAHLRPPSGECMMYVHRAVMLSWVGYDDTRPFVNHKNGVRTDNRLSNLEWCTHAENMYHAAHVLGRKFGRTVPRGAFHPRAKAVVGTHEKTGKKIYFDAMMDAERGGFKASGICATIAGRQRVHYEYFWSYQ